MAPRAYWKGYLRLSLVTCPIELFPATSQSEKTHFHQINTQTGHRLRQQMVDEATGKVVDKAHKGRGYELAKGRYVQIDEDELDRLTDSDGVSIGDAMRSCGLDPTRVAEAHRDDLEAYIEPHIEQGPVLYKAGDDIAVVVITGNGRAFSAGQDLGEMARIGNADDRAADRDGRAGDRAGDAHRRARHAHDGAAGRRRTGSFPAAGIRARRPRRPSDAARRSSSRRSSGRPSRRRRPSHERRRPHRDAR